MANGAITAAASKRNCAIERVVLEYYGKKKNKGVAAAAAAASSLRHLAKLESIDAILQY